MKKFIVALLAIAMVFAFSSCDDTSNLKSVDVATLEELNSALAALPESGVQVINITADIPNVAAQINVTEDVEINGNGHEISWSGTGLDKDKASAILVTSDSTIKNLTIKGNATLGDGRKWVEGEFGIKVAENSDAVLENIIVTKMNAGIQVQSSTVTLKGTINVDDNAWAGIAVTKESVGNEQKGDRKSTRLNSSQRSFVTIIGKLFLLSIWMEKMSALLKVFLLLLLRKLEKVMI